MSTEIRRTDPSDIPSVVGQPATGVDRPEWLNALKHISKLTKDPSISQRQFVIEQLLTIAITRYIL